MPQFVQQSRRGRSWVRGAGLLELREDLRERAAQVRNRVALGYE